MESQFNRLVEILLRLLGPNGCPWDKEQTLNSLCSSLLEETCETLEAIHLNDNSHIEEELGDLFFNIVFLCLVGEKEKRFNLESVLQGINEKLIRRHPHIFGDAVINTSDEVREQWEEIKKKEKQDRKHTLEGIPKDLPALARAYKVLKKIKKSEYSIPNYDKTDFEDDEQLGQMLLGIVKKANEKKIDPEQALRKALVLLEKDYLQTMS